MKIALIVGHDADRKGAYGNMGIPEWDFNDQYVNDLVFILPEKHEYYVLYRDTDLKYYGSQMKRLHNTIDNLGIELSIEFHFNGASDPTVNGNEVLYCATSKAGKEYAKLLDDCLDMLPNRDRGHKPVRFRNKPQKDDLGAGFCCRGKSVALITEPFFGSNQDKYVHDKPDRKLMDQAYIKFFEDIV